MDATSFGVIFTDFIDAVTDIITGNYGKVLLLLGGLIGAAFVIRLVKKHVGKK